MINFTNSSVGSVESYMRLAIDIARRGAIHGRLPFGSLIVDSRGDTIGVGSGTETPINPIRHSELEAIRMACARQGLLYGCTLFQTHEPCPMCAGAICHSKLSTVVVGSLRSDLPELFHQRDIKLAKLLRLTSTPPTLIMAPESIQRECIALFDDALTTNGYVRSTESAPKTAQGQQSEDRQP